MKIDDKVTALIPPAIAIIQPGQAHCEGFLPLGVAQGDERGRPPKSRRTNDYDLVWVLVDTHVADSLVISSRRQGRWSIPLHHGVSAGHVSQLTNMRASMGQRAARQAVDAFRSLLLAILSQAAMELSWQQFLSPTRPEASDRRLSLLKQVKSVIETHLDHPLTIQSLAELFGLTPNYLNHIFRQWTGEPIHAYLNRRRMDVAMDLCRNSDQLVKQIATRVGFDDPLYFSRAFVRRHCQSPQAIRNQSHPHSAQENP